MKTLLAYLSILMTITIFVADVFSIKYLGIWSILFCVISIPIIGILVGVSICCLDNNEN